MSSGKGRRKEDGRRTKEEVKRRKKKERERERERRFGNSLGKKVSRVEGIACGG